LMFVRP
jgi:hypothetical protein